MSGDFRALGEEKKTECASNSEVFGGLSLQSLTSRRTLGGICIHG